MPENGPWENLEKWSSQTPCSKWGQKCWSDKLGCSKFISLWELDKVSTDLIPKQFWGNRVWKPLHKWGPCDMFGQRNNNNNRFENKMGLIMNLEGSWNMWSISKNVSLAWWSWYNSVYVICCGEECVRWRSCEEMSCGSRVGWRWVQVCACGNLV